MAASGDDNHAGEGSLPKRTRDRDQVWELVKQGECDAAVELAREISNPWFKCQALCAAARATSEPVLRETLITEAFRAASEVKDVCRQVAVAAWPIRLLCDGDLLEQAQTQIAILLELINSEPNRTRRNDAIESLTWAVARSPSSFIMRMCDELMANARTGPGWRIDRSLRHVAKLVQSIDPTKAEEMVNLIWKPSTKIRAKAELSPGSQITLSGLMHSHDYSFGTTRLTKSGT